MQLGIREGGNGTIEDVAAAVFQTCPVIVEVTNNEPRHEKTCFAICKQQRRRSDPCSVISAFVVR